MIQQVMTAPGAIEFRDIPVPELKDDEVLVKIKRIGICGSDIHVYHGKHPFTKYPVTQGHEVSGQIVKLGKNVTSFRIGQKVTIEPQVTCGECYPCRHGKYNLCEELKVMGFQTTGCASEYFAAPVHRVTPLPDSMTYNQGAMIEPLAVTVHAARRFPELSGSNVAIIGCGPIGILLMQSCKALGAKSVMVTAFGRDKADVIYDCAGNDTTMGQAIKYARKGSKLVLVAVYAGMANVDLATLNDHELDLDTSMMYRHEDYIKAIELVADGKVVLEPLMSAHFAFRDYLDAYKYIDANREKTMKVIVDVDPEGK